METDLGRGSTASPGSLGLMLVRHCTNLDRKPPKSSLSSFFSSFFSSWAAFPRERCAGISAALAFGAGRGSCLLDDFKCITFSTVAIVEFRAADTFSSALPQTCTFASAVTFFLELFADVLPALGSELFDGAVFAGEGFGEGGAFAAPVFAAATPFIKFEVVAAFPEEPSLRARPVVGGDVAGLLTGCAGLRGASGLACPCSGLPTAFFAALVG